MFEVIKTNWNRVVKPTDTVYVIGDFGFGSAEKLKALLDQLNGKKINIRGNHDTKATCGLFHEWYDYLTFQYKKNGVKTQFCLFHYPIEAWDRKHYGSIHIHGHSHGNTPSVGIRRKDVCVKLINFTPICIDDVIEELTVIPVELERHTTKSS